MRRTTLHSALFPFLVAMTGLACGDDGGGDGLERQTCPGDITCPDEGDGTFYVGTAVVDVTPEGFRVAELAPGVTFEEVEEKTGTAILPPE